MSFYIFVALLILAALIICIPDDVYSFVRDLVDFNFPNLSSERSNINHNNNEPPVITHLACAICAENISPSDSLSVTRCGHMFHTACIATWLDQVENCPHCRTRCPRESMVRVYLNVSTDDQIPISAQAVIDDLQTNLKETQTRLSQREAEMETISEAHNAARKRIVDLHAHIDQAHSILQVSMKLNRLVPSLERKKTHKKSVCLSKIVTKLEVVMEMITEESNLLQLDSIEVD